MYNGEQEQKEKTERDGTKDFIRLNNLVRKYNKWEVDPKIIWAYVGKGMQK